uniref:Uncharacterized protein n=1 Tax=Periophthalmus magnuspinnatus TaxID=409849 RepID=A0A3B4AAR5_9GOBI
MLKLELDDPISRFRLAQSCVGLAGCLCVSYAIWTPFWLDNRGLWTAQGNNTKVERVFAVLSFLMAVSTGGLCLVFALCWTSETVRSYSNTRSLLMAGQALYPTTLLLLTMICTFFFLFSWSLFTFHHRAEIREDLSTLGSSYWIGALGWFLLMVVETIVFLAEQIVVPDIIPDLEKSVEEWRCASQFRSNQRSFSDGYFPHAKSSLIPKRYMSDP